MVLVSEQDLDAVIETFITHLSVVAEVGPDKPLRAAWEGHPPPSWQNLYPALSVIDTDQVPYAERVNEVFVPQLMAFEVRVVAPAVWSGGEVDARVEAQVQTRKGMSYFYKSLMRYENRIYAGYQFQVERIFSGMYDHYGSPAGVDTETGSLLWVRLAQVVASQF